MEAYLDIVSVLNWMAHCQAKREAREAGISLSYLRLLNRTEVSGAR